MGRIDDWRRAQKCTECAKGTASRKSESPAVGIAGELQQLAVSPQDYRKSGLTRQLSEASENLVTRNSGGIRPGPGCWRVRYRQQQDDAQLRARTAAPAAALLRNVFMVALSKTTVSIIIAGSATLQTDSGTPGYGGVRAPFPCRDPARAPRPPGRAGQASCPARGAAPGAPPRGRDRPVTASSPWPRKASTTEDSRTGFAKEG